GAGDDFINVHGMYAHVTEVINDSTVIVAPNGRYIGFSEGETAWVVDSLSMQRGESLKVRKQEQIFENNQLQGYRITFAKARQNRINVGDLLENKDRNPNVIIRNCRVL